MTETTTKITEVIDINRIMQLIPHRYPFLLVDKIIEHTPFESAIGIKNVTMNENFFQGHFPERPVMPGVLIIEAMAQVCAILVAQSIGQEAEGKLVYFTSIENAKFRKPVGPGDTLQLEVKKIQNRKNLWKFEAKATVDGTVMTEATIAAMLMM